MQKLKVMDPKHKIHSKSMFFLSFCILSILSISFIESPQEKKFKILYTHTGHGYLEPCACSNSLSGGMPRRATILARLTNDSTPTLTLDAGNFLSSEGSDTDSLMISLMKQLGYDALHISQSEIISPFVFPKHLAFSTNISIKNSEIPRYVELERNGVRFLVLGITTTSALSHIKKSIQNKITITPPLTAIDRILKKKKADVVIALVHSLDYQLEKKIAKTYKKINIIISTTFATEYALPRIFNNTIVTGLKEGGEAVAELKIRYHPKNKSISLVSYKQTLLDSSIPDNKSILNQIKAFKKEE